jgi:hypothetical protein
MNSNGDEIVSALSWRDRERRPTQRAASRDTVRDRAVPVPRARRSSCASQSRWRRVHA